MDSVLVDFSTYALNLREILNIGLSVLIPVSVFLVSRFLYSEWKKAAHNYRALSRQTKGLIGLGIFFSGDWIRAITVWIILHTFGTSGTYLTDVVPLVLALILSIVGLLCFIRNFTPSRDANGWPMWGGHRLWIAALTVYVAVIIINWWVL